MSWPRITIAELVARGLAEVQTGPFGTRLRALDYVEAGAPVINVRNLGYGRVRAAPRSFVDEPTRARLGEHVLRAGDIVFARKGAVDRHAYLRTEQAGWLQGSDCIRLRLDPTATCARFVSYALLCDAHKRWMLRQCSHAATMASLNADIVGRIRIPAPPLEIQRRVAALLCAYDELIDNNARRAAIVEQMARALFREWFVDLRFPGHERVEFVDSPLGPVPEGWSLSTADRVMQVQPATKLAKHGAKPYVPMASLSGDSMHITGVESRTGTGRAKFKNGDTLFARITPCLENGKIGFVQFLPDDAATGFGSTELFVLRERIFSPEMVYLLARTDSLREHAIKSMSGASGRQRAAVECFDNYRLVVPPTPLIERFTALVRPMFAQVHALGRQAELLLETRDLLLPRLMSGELELAHALAQPGRTAYP